MTEIKDTHEGMVRSLLSGQWVSKEDYQNVPYAVMYSNIYDAMPQSDIGQADVVFESPVEEWALSFFIPAMPLKSSGSCAERIPGN